MAARAGSGKGGDGADLQLPPGLPGRNSVAAVASGTTGTPADALSRVYAMETNSRPHPGPLPRERENLFQRGSGSRPNERAIVAKRSSLSWGEG